MGVAATQFVFRARSFISFKVEKGPGLLANWVHFIDCKSYFPKGGVCWKKSAI